MEIREIPNTAGKYLANAAGQIISAKRKRIMATTIARNGYPYVTIFIAGKPVKRDVHRLVALAFIPNPNSLPVVNHIDGIKTNVAAANLEWCTHSANRKHAIATGLSLPPPTMKGRFGAAHNRSKPVFVYNKSGILCGRFGGMSESARETGANWQAVGKSISAKQFSRSGLLYSYTELTAEAVIKLAAAAKERRTQGHKKCSKQIKAVAFDGSTVGDYLGQVAAARAYGITVANVMDSIRFHRVNQKSGLRFEYV